MSTLTTDLWGEADGPSRRGLLVDVATGAAFAVVVGLVQTQMGAWTWLAAVLLGAALAVRRVAPFVMVALAVAASVVQVVSGNVAWLACLAYVPLFVTLGGHRDVRVRRLGLACAAVAVVVAAGWEWNRLADERSLRAHVLGALALAASTAVVVVGSWIAGYLRWQRRQAVQARADATLQAVESRRLHDLYEQEQERSRIAADMHDLVAHSWAVVAAQADGARYVVREDPDRAQQALTVIGDTARSAMDDVRVLLGRLREQPPAEHALVFEQPDALVARMRDAGMDLHLDRSGGPAPTGLLDVTRRGVLTESLTNALKHGDLAQPVEVVEDWSEGYRLRVSNAANERPGSGQGHGLLGMAERVALVGGTLTADLSRRPLGRRGPRPRRPVHDDDPRRAGRRPGPVPGGHRHADRLAAGPRRGGRGRRRQRGRRAGRVLPPRRRADGCADELGGRGHGHARAGDDVRRPRTEGARAHHVRPRRGGGLRDRGGGERVRPQGRRAGVPARVGTRRRGRQPGRGGQRHPSPLGAVPRPADPHAGTGVRHAHRRASARSCCAPRRVCRTPRSRRSRSWPRAP